MKYIFFTYILLISFSNTEYLNYYTQQVNINSEKFYSFKFKYEINIPSGFIQYQASSKRIDLKLINKNGSSILVNVSERLSDEYKITAHDYTKEFLENSIKTYNPEISITKSEKMFIDGNKAFLIHYIIPSQQYKVLEIYFYKGDNAYVLTASTKISEFYNYENIFLETYKSIKFK